MAAAGVLAVVRTVRRVEAVVTPVVAADILAVVAEAITESHDLMK